MSNGKTAGEKLSVALVKADDKFELSVLIVEACRVADRLEDLDALISGERKLWARLRENREGDIYVSIDNALSEARQQANTLRQLLGEIHRQRAANPEGPTDDDLAGI